jgi:hypothetical protein
MLKFAVLSALAVGLAGCAGSSPFNSAPAAQVQPSGVYAQPGLARSQYECVTDEGNGRFMPCSGPD